MEMEMKTFQFSFFKETKIQPRKRKEKETENIVSREYMVKYLGYWFRVFYQKDIDQFFIIARNIETNEKEKIIVEWIEG